MPCYRFIALFGAFLASLVTTGATAAEARDVYYSYDIMGRQLTAKFDSASGADGITNTYDAFGNLKTSTISMAGFSKTLNSDYDEGGRRTRLTHPDSQAFTYAYDALDRPTGVYQGIGTTTSLDQFGYNNDGLLGSRTERLGSGVAYGYDPIGRLASLADSFSLGTGNVTVGLGYNPASQIVSQTRNNDSYAFGGSVAVNRNYAVNGLNQYSSAGPATFTYDANGNLTSDGTNTYVYDAENRLVTATAAGQTTTLTYDPLGRLWQVVKGSANTRFLYDGDALVAEYDSAGTITSRYVHGSNATADDPLVWYQGAGLTGERWLHANHQGSIVGVTNSSGGSPSINSYDEYGIPGAANVGRFQYTGQAWLGELGMYHYKARIYSPTLGRFLQTDPIGYDDQINLYAYVGNDPVNGVDPTGLCGSRLEGVIAAGCFGTFKIEGGTKETKLKPRPSNAQQSKKAKVEESRFAKVQRIGNEELRRTRRLVPGGGHNDIWDAERHARWVYRMAKEIDPATAALAAEGHELDGLLRGQPFREYRMDVNNNRVGMSAALSGGEIPSILTPGLMYIDDNSGYEK